MAPVYPAIFTGGIDPYLWEPTPAVTTLDLKPYRIELTPFAGLLDQGGSHTVSLSVFGADNYFSVEATLYLYLDHNAATDTGALVADTINQTTKVAQGLLIGSASTAATVPIKLLAEGIVSEDTVPFIIDPTTGGVSVGANSGAASAAFYGASGAAGCVGRLLASSANVLTYEQQASNCTTAALSQAMETAIAKR